MKTAPLVKPDIENTNKAFKYRIELSWQYSTIDFLGLPYLGSQTKANIGSIYVPLTFHPLRGDVKERSYLGEILKKHQHLVFLGGPGSGKSMLSQVFAYAFSKEGGESWTQKLGVNRMPILMTLRNYKTQKWKTIDDMLAEYIDQLSINSTHNISHQWLKECLEQGKVLLIWDGIDEIGGKQARLRLRTFFTEQIVGKGYLGVRNQNPKDKNIVVLTSRLSGYNEVSFDEFGLQPYVINGFDTSKRSDIDLFINNWFNAREPSSQAIEQIKKNISTTLHHKDDHSLALLSIATTPFLLAMILSVSRVSRGLPVDRGDLFDKIFDVYLVDIQRLKGFKVFDNLKIMKRCLAELAWRMFSENKDDTGKSIYLIDKEKAKEIIVSIKSDQGYAENFLKYIQQESGLLIEHSENCFSFAHPCFQEYLAAWKLRGGVVKFNTLFNECLKLAVNTQLHETLVTLFCLLEEFNINNELFDALYKKRSKNEKIMAQFFSKLILSSDNGLSESNKKSAIEFALEQSCKQLDLSIVELLGQLSETELIQNWFDEEAADKRIKPEETDFLITAFFLYPNLEAWIKKIKDRINIESDGIQVYEDNINNINSILGLLKTSNKNDFFITEAIRFCYEIKATHLTKKISKGELQAVKVDLKRDICSQTIHMAKVFETAFGVNVKNYVFFNFNEFLNDLVLIKADPIALEIILFNLMENAVKYAGYLYSQNKGMNICKCKAFVSEDTGNSQNICIFFEDEGIGIREEEKEKIFTSGYRTEEALRARSPGIQFMNIDLFSCRELAQKMGGNLELIKLKSPTTFKLTLPKWTE